MSETENRKDRRAGIVARSRGNHRAVVTVRVSPEAAGLVAPETVSTTSTGKADVPLSASGARSADACVGAVPAAERVAVRAAVLIAAVSFRDTFAAKFAVSKSRAAKVCDADIAAACGFGHDAAGEGAAAFRSAFGITQPSAPTGTAAPDSPVFVRADGKTTSDPEAARDTWLAVA